MTRNGKIARLPQGIREGLNRRLRDGEQGKQLVEWLNGLPVAQGVLKERFDGRAINEQNLSDWKLGGYEDWLKQEEMHDRMRSLGERAEGIDEQVSGEGPQRAVSDRLSVVLAAELAVQAEAMLAETTDPKERWARLKELLQQVGELRENDHRLARLRIRQEKWEREASRQDAEEAAEEIAAMKRKALAPIGAQVLRGTLAKSFGGGKAGEEIANYIVAVSQAGLTPEGEVEKAPKTEEATKAA